MCKNDDNNTTNQKIAPDTVAAVRTERGHVSSRGASNLALPMAYLQDFFTALNNPCHAVENPLGYIPVAVAENKLVTDLLQQRLAREETALAGFQESVDVYSYNNMLGMPVLRDTLAQFFHDRFLCASSQKPCLIRSDHIAVGAGVMSFLNTLFYALGNDRDAVLIPAPSYAAFDNDIRAYAGCVPIAVHCHDPAQGPTPQDWQTAHEYAQNELGLRVRFMLLTNPNNPLGVVYEPKIVQDSIDWARAQDCQMDIIVDEIYALSVFQEEDDDDNVTFKSVIQLLNNDLGTDVHVLWGLSKDFGSSGFRMGALYTQNEVLLEAISNLNAFACVSHPMQRMMAHMLSDQEFVDDFLRQSRQRLKASYDHCTSILKECDIPFTPAQAGMFVWIDLSSVLPSSTSTSTSNTNTNTTADKYNNGWNEEQRLSKLFVKHGRMVMTPGQSQHASKPGMFRICYAYVSLNVLKIGMERFRRIVTKIKERGWDEEWMEDDSNWKDVMKEAHAYAW